MQKQYDVILARLHSKLELEGCDEALRAAITAQQKRRALCRWIGLFLLVLGSVIFLSYGLDSSNFHQSRINESMIKAMWVFIPCLAVPFGWAVFTAYFSRSSMQKEITLVKQALTGSEQTSAQKAARRPSSHDKLLLSVRCAILCVGIGILVYGFLAGGTSDVLTKAINICTECVGLG